MSLPHTIPVRYTEEEAGYVTFRPVVKQTFRSHELLDMILSVTGKDADRVRRILKSGTLVFHSYRYWWEGLELGDDELRGLLAGFPDADPSRPFRPERCTMALIESSGTPPRSSLELKKEAVAHRAFLRRKSFWDALLAEAAAGTLIYQDYSFAHHADLYRVDLTAESRGRLLSAISAAPRGLRAELKNIEQAARVVFVCPRAES